MYLKTEHSKNKDINKKVINICFSASHEYLIPLCTALKSIFCNKDKNENLYILILDKDLTNKDKIYIKSIADSNSLIIFIKINEKSIKRNCILRNDISHINSYATYYRFLLADLTRLDKILYLDSDIIVRSSLLDLYNTDLGTNIIAGVVDSYEKENCTRLKLDRYINAGVLLINLKQWRIEHITNKLFTWSINHKDKIVWLDQDIINAVLQNKIQYLDTSYNTQVSELEFGLTKQFNKNADTAKIIHYVGHKKPWIKNKFKLSKYYYKYLLKTKFAYTFFLMQVPKIIYIKQEKNKDKTHIVVKLFGIKFNFRKERL